MREKLKYIIIARDGLGKIQRYGTVSSKAELEKKITFFDTGDEIYEVKSMGTIKKEETFSIDLDK